jgi:hypothetical protein
MKKTILYVVLALIIGGASFYGGVCFAGGGSLQANAFQPGSQGAIPGTVSGSQQGGRMQVAGGTAMSGLTKSGNPVNGEILSVDGQNLTIKLRDGGSKIVLFSSTTDISKSVEGEAADLVAGKNVVVSGTTNSDGSVTAKTIQLRTDVQPLQNGEDVPKGESTGGVVANGQ